MRIGSMMMAAVAMLVATPAMATDWRMISTATSADGDKAFYLIDRDSIKLDGDHRNAALYLIAGGFVLNAAVEFDCAAGRFRPTSGWIVEGDGEKQETGMAVWQDGVGTSHEVLFNYVCQFDGTKADAHVSYGAGDPVPAIRAQLDKAS